MAVSGLHLRDENAGLQSSEVIPFEILVYGEVDMTDFDIVKETKAVVLPPRFQAFPV